MITITLTATENGWGYLTQVAGLDGKMARIDEGWNYPDYHRALKRAGMFLRLEGCQPIDPRQLLFEGAGRHDGSPRDAIEYVGGPLAGTVETWDTWVERDVPTTHPGGHYLWPRPRFPIPLSGPEYMREWCQSSDANR